MLNNDIIHIEQLDTNKTVRKQTLWIKLLENKLLSSPRRNMCRSVVPMHIREFGGSVYIPGNIRNM